MECTWVGQSNLKLRNRVVLLVYVNLITSLNETQSFTNFSLILI